MRASLSTLILTWAAANTAYAAVIPAEHRLAIREEAPKPPAAAPAPAESEAKLDGPGPEQPGASGPQDAQAKEAEPKDGEPKDGEPKDGKTEGKDGKTDSKVDEKAAQKCLDAIPIEDAIAKKGVMNGFKTSHGEIGPATLSFARIISNLVSIANWVPEECYPILEDSRSSGDDRMPSSDEVKKEGGKDKGFKYEPIGYAEFGFDGNSGMKIKWVHSDFFKEGNGDKKPEEVLDEENQPLPLGYFHKEGGKVVVDSLDMASGMVGEFGSDDTSKLTPEDFGFKKEGDTIKMKGMDESSDGPVVSDVAQEEPGPDAGPEPDAKAGEKEADKAGDAKAEGGDKEGGAPKDGEQKPGEQAEGAKGGEAKEEKKGGQ